jgi:hypothetical protein
VAGRKRSELEPRLPHRPLPHDTSLLMTFLRAFQAGLLMVALLGAWAPAAQQRGGQQRRAPAPAPAVAETPVPFRAGETLVYNIAWRLFSAGEARMHIDRGPGGRGWQASINAVSTGFVSKLYRVDDSITSIFDATSLCSQSVEKIQNEGRRHRDIHIEFHRDRKVAAMRETDPTNGQLLKQAEYPTADCVYDVVSALYYVRTLPLEVGHTFQLQLSDGGPALPITVEVQAREDVKTDVGTFHAIRIEPRLTGGSLFRRNGRIQVWFTDDSQRMLVKMNARLFVGTISATLQQVEHK